MSFFERIFKKELQETKEQGHIMEIVAVTGPEGVSGSKGPEETLWTAGITLTAWRLCDVNAPVHHEMRRLMAEVDDEDLKWLQRMIKKDCVVKLQVREIAGGFELEELLESYCNDAEMLEICSSQQEPVYFEDEELGRFELNRAAGVYEQLYRKNGMEVRVTFDADEDTDRMQLALQTARTLLSNLPFWAEAGADYAAEQLLELKNTTWRQEEEEEMSQETFAAALWLNDILALPGGKFQLWFNDGDLFGGLAVYVDGSIYGRFTKAGI